MHGRLPTSATAAAAAAGGQREGGDVEKRLGRLLAEVLHRLGNALRHANLGWQQQKNVFKSYNMLESLHLALIQQASKLKTKIKRTLSGV